MSYSLQIEVWEGEGATKRRTGEKVEWQQRRWFMQSQGIWTVRTDVQCWTIIPILKDGSGDRMLYLVIEMKELHTSLLSLLPD